MARCCISARDKSPTDKAIEQGQNCRALWRSVVLQAMLDSEKKEFRNRCDLPRVIGTSWWRQILIFADLEGELNKINEIILGNCHVHETGKKPIYRARKKIYYGYGKK